jgi:hypothetical protein
MLNSNLQSAAIIRQMQVINPDGTSSDVQDCEWMATHNIYCGMIHNSSNHLNWNKEFEVSEDIKYLTFDMKDQAFTTLDILLTDYLAVSYDGTVDTIKLYKIIGITDDSTICGCSVKLTLQRITPRDCGITLIECNRLLIPDKYVIN